MAPDLKTHEENRDQRTILADAKCSGCLARQQPRH